VARIRYLKPDFFSDEDVAELSFPARLLFQGLWTLADREGRLEDRPAWIRVLIFPYDNAIAIGELLEELCKPRTHSQGAFIERYTVGEQRFIQIRNFAKHQKPHPREAPSSIPAMPSREKVLPSREKVVPSRVGNGDGNGNGEVGRTEQPASVAFRAEKAIYDSRAQAETKLLRTVALLADRLGRDPPGVMVEVTSYRKADGTVIKGRENPADLGTVERVKKSLEDAEGWLADLEKGA
jgi:hypothetical protein